jgi:hypothetical protein
MKRKCCFRVPLEKAQNYSLDVEAYLEKFGCDIFVYMIVFCKLESNTQPRGMV